MILFLVLLLVLLLDDNSIFLLLLGYVAVVLVTVLVAAVVFCIVVATCETNLVLYIKTVWNSPAAKLDEDHIVHVLHSSLLTHCCGGRLW